jgi:hypothetical protein
LISKNLIQVSSVATMPKLSKRKRQLKEIYYRKNESEGASENNTNSPDNMEDDDENDSQEEIPSQPTKPVVPVPVKAVPDAPSKGTRSSTQRHSVGGQSGRGNNPSSSDQTNDKATEGGGVERVWVQCNTCDKWRSLPGTVNPDTLPDIWTCDLNHYDPDRAACDAPEESYYKGDDEQQHVQLKSFLRLWVKKLRTADRAENRMSAPAMTRGRKRKLDVEWIKCCNPQCGKWRAVTRGIETANLLKRLNKNKKFGEALWFCTMNSWDETTASCAAPQEPLWNCRWNFSNSL